MDGSINILSGSEMVIIVKITGLRANMSLTYQSLIYGWRPDESERVNVSNQPGVFGLARMYFVVITCLFWIERKNGRFS